MATLQESIKNLPLLEKIGIMEQIWSELSKNAADFDPPSWHLAELEETERRVESGEDYFENWETVRRILREA